MINDHNSPSEIEREITRTRADIDRTIDGLRDQLSPGQLLDRALGPFRGEASEFAHNVGERVKANPIPLAMLASSVAWLMISEKQPSRTKSTPAHRMGGDVLVIDDHEALSMFDRVERATAAIRKRADETVEAFGERWIRARATALGIQHRAEEDLAALRDRVEEAVGRLAHRAKSARNSLSERLSRSHEPDDDLPPGIYRLKPEDRDTLDAHHRAHDAMESLRRNGAEISGAAAETYYDAKAKALGLTREAKENFDTFRDRVDQAFSDLTHRAGAIREDLMTRARDLGDEVRHRAADVTSGARQKTTEAGRYAENAFREQPLVIGAIGVALGALAGALIPMTRRENETFGKAGDTVRSRAEDYAEEAVDTAGRVARNTVDAGKEAAREAHLTPEDVANKVRQTTERAKNAAHKTTRTAADEVEKELDRHT